MLFLNTFPANNCINHNKNKKVSNIFKVKKNKI